jgi:glycosyltransferase involved in cell wall biosynthesis
VAAAAILAERYPQLKFVMVGADAGARNEVEQQISALQLKSKVFLFDTDPRPETIFAGIDIYVCASDTEGFSNVLLEALACGKPVIATNVGGNPEIITHGENGFLVPARSPASLATAAEVLICDPNLRKAMGARGRKLVEQKFSLAGMVSRHEDLYTSLISEHSH